MSIRRIKQGAGLWTDVSPLDAPEGALRQADNVLMHRPGIIQPRIGFGDTSGVAARTTDFRPIRFYDFDGGMLVHSIDGSDYRLERLGVATVLDSTNMDPVDATVVSRVDAAQARGSIYFCTNTGIRKVSDIADTATVRAGVFTDYLPPLDTVTSTGGDASRHGVDTTSVVAYRYCWVSEDANGYVRRSAPSSRWLRPGTQQVVMFDRIYLPTGIAAGDRLELYRTESVAAASTPPAEYFLAVEYTVTSTDASAGYIAKLTIVDDVIDTKLGAMLYTNPSQGGIVNANEPPPRAQCIAQWSGCMWYGNTQSKHSVHTEVVAVYDSADTTFDRTGLHYSSGTYDFASSASTLIADGSDVNGLRTGQYINEQLNVAPDTAGTYIPANTKIQTIRSHCQCSYASINDGDTITVLGTTFTWRTSSPGADEIEIGGADSTAAANLATALGAKTFEGLIDLTIATSPSDTVRVSDPDGHGINVAVTGTGVAVEYQVDIDDNTTGGIGSNVTLYHRDWVTVNGVEFYAHWYGASINHYANAGLGETLIDQRFFYVDDTSTSPPQGTAQGLANAIAAYSIVEDTSFGVMAYVDVEQALGGNVADGEILFLRQYPEQAAFSFECTVRPEAFRPTVDPARSSDSTTRANRLYWSKPQEPEAVPVLNFTDIGREDKAILALEALDNALLVFKEDGIYRVTGNAPGSWVVDELDGEKRILRHGCTTVLDNVCYAWTDRGIFPVTEAGVAPQPISLPVADLTRGAQTAPLSNPSDTARGYYMSSHPRLGLVIVAVGQDEAEDPADYWLVWHRATGAWAKWDVDNRCAAYDPAEDRMLIGDGENGWKPYYERAAGTYYDRSAAITSVTDPGDSGGYSRVSFTTSQVPTVPFVGDAWVNSGSTYRVRAVSSPGGGVYVLTLDTGGLTIAATGTWLEGYSCALLWQAQHAAGLGHVWQELHAELGDTDLGSLTGGMVFSVGGASHRDSSPSSVDATITSAATYSDPLRVGLPRACVRTPQLYPYISSRNAGAFWELTHLYLHHSTASQRVMR